MKIEHVQPSGLFKAEGFSQVVVGAGKRLAFIAGQGAFDAQFQLVGRGDHFAQAMQAFRNLVAALEALGAGPEQIVSTTMYVVGLTPETLERFTSAMSQALDGRPFPPNAATLVGVERLAMPDMLVEISAIALLD
ncbi:MAG TPA: RidA family protein [Steroidobacter sp.]|jgi:enamine deaminase RidA (YjgF/YER057c/UK114 family)|nr:RidA family protein [Steroidobacteraceae bacterium]HLS82296.1 RidA family protein [Steroidobacter sp.]